MMTFSYVKIAQNYHLIKAHNSCRIYSTPLYEFVLKLHAVEYLRWYKKVKLMSPRILQQFHCVTT